MEPPKLHPTGLHPGSLAAEVLDFMYQGGLGLDGLAAAADVVAADCRHSAWVASEVKGSNLSEDNWLRMLDEGEAIVARCRSAMAAFAADGSHEKLRAELAEVAAYLNRHELPPA